MRPIRIVLALAFPVLFAGCGFVHFGRQPAAPAGGGDAALAAAYSNLSTEHKILKQELVLARREGDTLRVALERSGGGANTDMIARLNETTRELASLRAAHAKLQAERAAGTAAPSDAPRLAEIEEKLAASLRNYTTLQDENTRLRAEIDRARSDNVRLAEDLRSAAARTEAAQAALSQLNTELLAQKQARARAEQSAEAMRSQLSAVMAQRGEGGGGSSALSGLRESAAQSTAALDLGRPAPTPASPPTAELRTSVDRVKTAAAASGGERTHTVQVGDTLEKISRQYYGAPERWRAIYDANRDLLGNGQPLRAGMELKLP
jgi:nucleoid-associated protein YgaU